MIKGYKYLIDNSSKTFSYLTLQNSIEENTKTMKYDKMVFKTQKDFFDRFFTNLWINDLNSVYSRLLSKINCTIGIGSGVGEHELLLFHEGFDVIASDIIPGLSEQTTQLFPGFKTITIDIFNDDIIQKINEKFDISSDNFDILITGLDFYFNNEDTQRLFDICSGYLKKGNNLIFTLRYPDSISRRLIEFWLFIEAIINHYVFKKGIIQKEKGYRRKRKEIVKMAEKAGFVLNMEIPSMFGCECTRCRLLGALFKIFRITDHFLPLFNCAFVMKFVKK